MLRAEDATFSSSTVLSPCGRPRLSSFSLTEVTCVGTKMVDIDQKAGRQAGRQYLQLLAVANDPFDHLCHIHVKQAPPAPFNHDALTLPW